MRPVQGNTGDGKSFLPLASNRLWQVALFQKHHPVTQFALRGPGGKNFVCAVEVVPVYGVNGI